MMMDLFAHDRRDLIVAPGAIVLAGFALPHEQALIENIAYVTNTSPFRHMITPGGFPMSVAMSNCGEVGWVSERSGYRYDTHDPQTGNPWPAMPEIFQSLAQAAATKAGFSNFIPDACLINRYAPGAKLSLHQDKDEPDESAPIVSLSLGLPATFLFGGLKRTDPTKKINLQHGDVVVWGGESRLAFHGIMPLKVGSHPLLGETRINLTFRKVRT